MVGVLHLKFDITKRIKGRFSRLPENRNGESRRNPKEYSLTAVAQSIGRESLNIECLDERCQTVQFRTVHRTEFLITHGIGGKIWTHIGDALSKRKALTPIRAGLFEVDRGGIEPPTPGFSVLCSTN